MNQQTRELLVTTKIAQSWQDDFDQKVDELMNIVSRIDTERSVQNAAEMLDVYHTTSHKPKPARKKKLVRADRPFEFLVFRN